MGAATSALLLLLLHLATCLWPMAARAASSASSATGDHIVLGSGSTAVTLPTVINGCWQFAGGHGQLSRPDLLDAMKSLRGAGLYAFDTADIYGPSEEIVGEFVKRTLAEGGSSQPEPPPVILTKLVPRSDDAPADVFTATIERSLRALNVQTLDVVQFHTWDYAGAFTKPLQRLQQLQGDGKIKQIGLTNFDTLHMTAALDGGFPIVSNQVQWSLLDRRPEVTMLEVAAKRNIALLTYGSIGGGLLSDRWLGREQPTSRADLDTASLGMYYRSLQRTFRGWEDFQDLLKALRGIADRHGVDIAAVASRYVLDTAAKAGCQAAVIVGMRGDSHLKETAGISSFRLDEEDFGVIGERMAAPYAMPPTGDVYSYER